MNESIRVLLVEDDAGEAELIKRSLKSTMLADFVIQDAASLTEALLYLEKGNQVHLALLDLNLPDSRGLETFMTFQEKASSLPVILMTGYEDEDLALRAIRSGAQDYIVKGAVRPDQTARAMKFAIERHRMMQGLLDKSLTDELTRLYNRRGFNEIAQNQIKLSARSNKELILIYLDLDNMKGVNDNFGHEEGDHMICDAAEIIKDSFRETDIVARVGGDEFLVLALGTSPDYAGIIATRLLRNVSEFNKKGLRPYNLSISLGISGYDPRNPCELAELITRADNAMYMDKRSHKSWLASKH